MTAQETPEELLRQEAEFPVIVRHVGVVGTVTVSGLPQAEEHRLVVAVLRGFSGLQGAAARG